MLHPAQGGSPHQPNTLVRVDALVSTLSLTRENQTMKRVLATGVLTASLIAGGAVAVATINTKDLADTPGKGAARSFSATHLPQDVITEDGVSRIFGVDRYGTAAAISQAYGWTFDNTGTVYIASGADYPDALAIGLSHFMDGPLLLVSKTGIPKATRDELTRLEPCFIHVMGGTGAVNPTIFTNLKTYANPSLCGEP